MLALQIIKWKGMFVDCLSLYWKNDPFDKILPYNPSTQYTPLLSETDPFPISTKNHTLPWQETSWPPTYCLVVCPCVPTGLVHFILPFMWLFDPRTPALGTRRFPWRTRTRSESSPPTTKSSTKNTSPLAGRLEPITQQKCFQLKQKILMFRLQCIALLILCWTLRENCHSLEI